jgi:hypothetical protein
MKVLRKSRRKSKSRVHGTKAKGEAPAPTKLGGPPIQKTLEPSLDRGQFIESFSQNLGKVKEANTTITSFVAVLEQLIEIERRTWEKAEATLSPGGPAYIV